MPSDEVEDEHVDGAVCATAAELVQSLGLTDPRWGADPSHWCFRGQDWDEPLVPTALRPVRPGSLTFLPVDHERAFGSFGESLLIHKFIRAADRAGLEIPHDSPRLREYIRELDNPREALAEHLHRRAAEWPDPELLAVLALAQHYGVPTRLLDWSWRPLVAAYFATVGIAREAAGQTRPDRYDERRTMVVWALNTVRLSRRMPSGRFSCVEAPYSSNPNLSAQAGLFTLDRQAARGVGLETALPSAARHQERAMTSAAALLTGEADPFFFKFTLPHGEARPLLRLLELGGVSAASIFPGHAGVVQSMYERRCWDT
jgi:hypothetical protein